MPPVAVTDPTDTRLDPYRSLTDAEARRRIEGGGGGIFVVEGHLAVTQLLASPYPVRSLLVSSSRARALPDLLAAVAARSAPVLVAEPDVVSATVGFNLHRGVVAIGGRLPAVDPADVVAVASGVVGPDGHRTALVLVAEGVNDQENLGALYRNAAAFGVAAVLLDPTAADPLYRRCIRVSMGHALRIPTARFADWPGGLRLLVDAGFEVVALTPAQGATPLESLPGGRATALLVGAEGPGLTAAALGAATRRARIGIAAAVDSLNVATAAAIALHHYRSQRAPAG